jgi:hypothetical protein
LHASSLAVCQPHALSVVVSARALVSPRVVRYLLAVFVSIALARGLYCFSPVLLIDDALSALDGPVAAAAWATGIGKARPGAPPSLLDSEGRARVVVTNNAALVRDADIVLVRCTLMTLHAGAAVLERVAGGKAVRPASVHPKG